MQYQRPQAFNACRHPFIDAAAPTAARRVSAYGACVIHVVDGIALVGKGADATRLVPQGDCQNHWPLVAGTTPGQYQSVIQMVRSPAASVRGVEIDLVNVRRDCGYTGNHAVLVNRSPNSQVS